MTAFTMVFYNGKNNHLHCSANCFISQTQNTNTFLVLN